MASACSYMSRELFGSGPALRLVRTGVYSTIDGSRFYNMPQACSLVCPYESHGLSNAAVILSTGHVRGPYNALSQASGGPVRQVLPSGARTRHCNNFCQSSCCSQKR